MPEIALSSAQKAMLNRPEVQALIVAFDLVPVASEADTQSVRIVARVDDWFAEFSRSAPLRLAHVTPGAGNSLGK